MKNEEKNEERLRKRDYILSIFGRSPGGSAFPPLVAEIIEDNNLDKGRVGALLQRIKDINESTLSVLYDNEDHIKALLIVFNKVDSSLSDPVKVYELKGDVCKANDDRLFFVAMIINKIVEKGIDSRLSKALVAKDKHGNFKNIVGFSHAFKMLVMKYEASDKKVDPERYVNKEFDNVFKRFFREKDGLVSGKKGNCEAADELNLKVRMGRRPHKIVESDETPWQESATKLKKVTSKKSGNPSFLRNCRIVLKSKFEQAETKINGAVEEASKEWEKAKEDASASRSCGT